MRLIVLMVFGFSTAWSQSPEDLNNEGVNLLNSGKYKEALPIFEQLVKQSPDNTLFRYHRAIANANLNNNLDALIDFQVLYELTPGPEYAFQTGNMYERLDSLNLSLRYYDKAIELEKEYFLYYFKRGTIYLKMERFREAITDFDESIALNPGYNNAWHNRGIAKYKSGHETEGCEDWCQALLKGNNVSAIHLEKNCKRYPEPCVLKP